MTQKEIQATTIGIDTNGRIGLCKQNKAGKSVMIREITPEECAAICATQYALYRKIHPNEDVMLLPYAEGSVLAVTQVPNKQE